MPNNPQAFPVPFAVGPAGDVFQAYDGMTLRDWFAGQALAGMCANPSMFDGCGSVPQVNAQVGFVTNCATMIADAMNAEREKTP